MSEQSAERTPVIEAQFQEPTPDGVVWTAAVSKEAAVESAAFLDTNYRVRVSGEWVESSPGYVMAP